MKTATMLMLLLLAAAPAFAQGWSPAGGPQGGDVSGMAVDGNTMLIGTMPGIIYRHDQSGWKRLGQLRTDEIHAVEGGFLASSEDGIYRTTDRGESWTKVGPQAIYPTIVRDGGILYTASDSVILRSVSNGLEWHPYAEPGMDFFTFHVHDSISFVSRGGTGGGLFRSGDDGRTWARVTAGLPEVEAPQAFHYHAGAFYLALDRYGVFRSTDGGITWSDISEGLPKPSGIYPSIRSFASVGDQLWGAGRDGTYAYDGSGWTLRSLGQDRVITTSNGILYRGSLSGVTFTADRGVTWGSLNNGLMAYRVDGIVPFRNMAIASMGGAIYRLRDLREGWTRVNEIGIGKFASTGTTLYGLGYSLFSQGLFRSTDGLDWGRVGNDLPYHHRWITSLVARGDVVLVGYYRTSWEHNDLVWTLGGVYRSTDRGATWHIASNGLPDNKQTEVPIIDMIYHGDTLLAHTLDGVYRSANYGGSWERVSGSPASAQTHGRFAGIGEKVFLAGSNMVHISTDGGESWSPTEGIPAEGSINYLSAAHGGLYASVMVGAHLARIYRLNGTRWEDITDRFPDGVQFQEFIEVGEKVFAGTFSSSVWVGELEVPASAPSGVDGGTDLAAAPNPIRSEGMLSFHLRERGPVRITLISSLGQELATVHEGVMEQGAQQVRFDAGSLADGVYYLRLTGDGEGRSVPVVKVR